MKLRDLLPADVLDEMGEVAYELKRERADFDPVRDPMDRISVMLHWCVREIVKIRKERDR